MAAAEAGHPRACLNRGAKALEPAEVVRWYELAVAAGSVEAAKRLAAMYTAGAGVAVDEERARHWREQERRLGERNDE